jgi:peroxidase
MNVTTGVEENMLLFDSDSSTYFMADPRDNDSAGLIAMHTLAVRNHNYWAGEVVRLHPQWTDEQVFWKARQLNIAEWQRVVYHEWLPALLGALAPSARTSLSEADLSVGGPNKKISIEVAEVVMPALIQTMTPPTFYDSATFASTQGTTTTQATGIDTALRRAVRTRAKKVDALVTSALRSVVVDSAARDSAAESIQRDRAFRIPDWAAVYTCFGAVPIAGDDRDAFEGFLEEEIYPGSSMGLTMGSVLAAQFVRTRDSDPLFYQYDSVRAAIGPVLFPAIRSSNFRSMLYRNTHLAFADIGSGDLFTVRE